MIQLDILTKV